jgi:hypothetical protein
MLKLRKIPLEPLIQILQDLYDSGADYIDISGEQNGEGESLKDIIQITVKPDYMSDPEDVAENIEMDYSDDDIPDTTRTLSDDDINNLIE